MDITYIPKSLTYNFDEVNDGQTCEIYLKILRGPLKWESNPYQLTPHSYEINFDGEKLEKSSGFYFTKDGPEFKKATFKVIKKGGSGQ